MKLELLEEELELESVVSQVFFFSWKLELESFLFFSESWSAKYKVHCIFFGITADGVVAFILSSILPNKKHNAQEI